MKIRFLILLAIFGFTGCYESGQNNQPVTIHGTIRIKTVEDGTYVVLAANQPENKTGGNRDYLIKGPLTEELRSNFRGKAVTLEGRLCSSSLSQIADCLRPAKIMID